MAEDHTKQSPDFFVEEVPEEVEEPAPSGAEITGAPYGQGWPEHTADDHPADDAPVQPVAYGAAALMTDPDAPGAPVPTEAKADRNGKSDKSDKSSARDGKAATQTKE